MKRLFPFDTGASQPPRAYYEPHVLPGDALTKFSINAVIENAQRIVHTFFETDANYLKGQARIGLAFTPGEITVQAYYNLIQGGAKPECDDRCSAIEIQTDAKVDLRGQLAAVVLPTSFLEDESLRKTLFEQWHAFPLTYGADIGMRPTEFHGVIREKIKQHYKDLGLI